MLEIIIGCVIGWIVIGIVSMLIAFKSQARDVYIKDFFFASLFGLIVFFLMVSQEVFSGKPEITVFRFSGLKSEKDKKRIERQLVYLEEDYINYPELFDTFLNFCEKNKKIFTLLNNINKNKK